MNKNKPTARISPLGLYVVRQVASEFCLQHCFPGTVGHHKDCIINLWEGSTVNRKLKDPPASSKGQDS